MSKKLSIVVPVFNESQYIIRSLENILNTKIPAWKSEIIVVNDGSTDNTLSLLKEIKKRFPDLELISTPVNYGKGSALKKGIHKTCGDVVIVQDGDLEYDPSDFRAILEKYSNKDTNVVYGSRILGAKIYHNYSANVFYLMGGIMLTKVVNLLFGIRITDQPTCYKSWRGNLSEGLLEYCRKIGFEMEIEMTSFFSKVGGICEVPIHYYPRTVNHGKKIRLTDFFKSVATALNCRFFR